MAFDRERLLVDRARPGTATTGVIGVLPGEGVGREVVGATLRVLEVLADGGGPAFELREGGPIGLESEALSGEPLSSEVTSFCDEVFQGGGAVLAGPGGGRFVYDLRERFDLFYKLSPLQPVEELAAVGRLRGEHVAGVDVLVVRENDAGFYHGTWASVATGSGRAAEHRFEVTERRTRRLLEVAADRAAQRRGHLAVVVKTAGVPAVSELWRDCAHTVAAETGVACTILEVDYAAYCLLQRPRELDVVAAPDLYGDVLADIGGVLVGSRGLTYSGNFSPSGSAVYQTNHGAAYDLAGTDRANPAGQILSLAMMLEESFGLRREAELVRHALRDTWRAGWRTADVAEAGCTVVGTRAFGELVAETLGRLAG
jgi:3-isopropylmalate dehydrogenase